MSIWQWSSRLPNISERSRLTLGEGSTPLIASRHIGPKAGVGRMMFKVETANPTGSYKDRFAACAISHMVAQGQTRCVATSSGNTGSALAAYCTAAAISCHVVIVESAPRAKLTQMLCHGAQLFYVRGFGLDPQVTERTFEKVAALARQPGAALQISAFKYSPVGMEGVKTIAYELMDGTNGAIDDVFVPVGGGGLALAVARGCLELAAEMRVSPPRVHCVQPAGNNTIAGPLRAGYPRGVEVSCTSRISGLQVPNLMDGNATMDACRATGGTGFVVSDEAIYVAQRRLAREEGVLCEPAGATPLAAALDAIQTRQLDPDATMVCLVTGAGFKDSSSVEAMVADHQIPLVELDELAERMGSHREAEATNHNHPPDPRQLAGG